MILTNCAACAAPLADDHKKRCSRCKTRYCDEACQRGHWERGGHDALCRRIKRAGGAEQYHAEKKYKEAVAEAVEACRGRHEGQKCYICLEAVHARTGEGLVRGCACGDRDGVSSPELGVAHVSCLARQAKILREEAEYNNLGAKVTTERWDRWQMCSLCQQDYHGVVACALGWACWKTYVGRLEGSWTRLSAMTVLGNGLYETGRYEDALSVFEASLDAERRFSSPEENILSIRIHIARCYGKLGRLEDAVAIEREVYAREKVVRGPTDVDTLIIANNLVYSLVKSGHYAEAKTMSRKLIPQCRRAHGPDDDLRLLLRQNYAEALYSDAGASRADVLQAVAILEDVTRASRQTFGAHHPRTLDTLTHLEGARMKREDVAA